MVYIKYMPFQSIRNASRNRREISAAHEYGFETIVFSCDPTKDDGMLMEGYEKHIWDGTSPLKPSMPRIKKIYMMIKNRLSLYSRTLMLPNGVWSCQDLLALRIAWLISRLRIRKPILIYDAHEFELGRNTKRTAIQQKSVKYWERFLMSRCAFSIVVNETIADEIQKIYGFHERPIVVRSTPSLWIIDPDICKRERMKMIQYFSESFFEEGKQEIYESYKKEFDGMDLDMEKTKSRS